MTTKSTLLQCNYEGCLKEFPSTEKLEIHKRLHTGEKPYICNHPGCDRAYTRQSSLYMHARTHTRPKPFCCKHPGCTKAFAFVKELELHERSHFGPKPWKCVFEGCDCSFARKDGLTNHMRTHNPHNKSYECEVCDKRFSTKNGLTKHTRIHSDERPFRCDYGSCNAAFKDSSALRDHRYTHTGEKPHVCTFQGCDKAFSTAGSRNAHSRIHSDERPFQCPVDGCSKAYKQHSALRNHERVHAGKRIPCPYEGCDRTFQQKGSLTVHVRTHEGIKPYSCEFEGCNQSFTTADHRNVHHRVHTREKPYVCPVEGCDKRFRQCGYLRIHEYHHSGERPFQCSFEGCGKRFVQSSALKNHTNRIHLGPCSNCIDNWSDKSLVPVVSPFFRADKLCEDCGRFKHGDVATWRSEHRLAKFLIERFNDHPLVNSIYLDQEDPSEDACSNRRPDIRIDTDFGMAIVENDEQQHRSSKYACVAADIKSKWSDLISSDLEELSKDAALKLSEDSRMSEITTTGEISPTIFWRLNPDNYRDCSNLLVDVPEEVRFEKLAEDIVSWLDQEWEPDHFIQVVYLYFNGPIRQEDFVPTDGDEYDIWRTSVSALGMTDGTEVRGWKKSPHKRPLVEESENPAKRIIA